MRMIVWVDYQCGRRLMTAVKVDQASEIHFDKHVSIQNQYILSVQGGNYLAHAACGAHGLLFNPVCESYAESRPVPEVVTDHLRPVSQHQVNVVQTGTPAKPNQTFQKRDAVQRDHRFGNVSHNGPQPCSQAASDHGTFHDKRSLDSALDNSHIVQHEFYC